MVAPFPSSSTNIPRDTQELVHNYQWIARWSDEINTDQGLNLKKLGQLVFYNTRKFNAILAANRTDQGFLIALASAFAVIGISWAGTSEMVSDLDDIATAALSLAQHVRTTFPAARTVSRQVFDNSDIMQEEDIVVETPEGVGPRVAALRAMFS